MSEITLKQGFSLLTDPESNRKIIVQGVFDENELTQNEIDVILDECVDYDALYVIRNRCSIEQLIDFANEVRKHGGSNDMLSELIPSDPQNSKGCLIANALNFESEIEAGNNDDWTMTIEDGDIVRSIGEGLGLRYIINGTEEEFYNESTGEYEYSYLEDEYGYVILPEEIGLAAAAFDTYRDYELECFNAHSAIITIEEDFRN